MGTTSAQGRSSSPTWLRGGEKMDRQEREGEGKERGNHDDIRDMTHLEASFIGEGDKVL